MEEFSTEHPLQERDENLLLGSKDPQLSHVYGDGPNTPSVVTATDANSSQGVMDDGGQFHDEHNRELEYSLFEEQPYVPDMSPSHIVLAENTGSSLELHPSHKILEGKIVTSRSNGPTNGKAFFCTEPNCSSKSFSNIMALHKHFATSHGNNISEIETMLRERGTALDAGDASETVIQQNYKVVNNAADYQQHTTASVILQYKGAAHNQTSSAHINASQSNDVLNSVAEMGFPQLPQEGTNQYNMLLLAQHAAQNHPHSSQAPTQQAKSTQQTEFLQHQSSMALQEIALGVNLRSSQCSIVQDTMSSPSNQMIRECAKAGVGRQFVSNPAHITGVRAQLRKSLSSNGKLENINASTREWNRLPIHVGRSLDSSTSAITFMSMRMRPENDPTNIDNAPILKNLLADSKSERRMSSSDNQVFTQENGHIASSNYNDNLHNSWPNEQSTQQNNLRSPLLAAKRNEFQYSIGMKDQQQTNPSPLHSPNYTNNPQFTMPLPQSHQTTPLPQNEEQFFAADNMMVNNNNGQAMDVEDKTTDDLDKMIIESVNLVQDLIDAEANSNQSQQILPFRDRQQSLESQRLTPPPAYNIDPSVNVIQGDPAVQMFMGQNQNVKSEPQSPMLMSPMAQRSFFGGNQLPVHSNNMPLASPTTPHQVPMHPGMHPQTPVGEASWQFPMSGPAQNYGSVPQSPVTPAPVNSINMAQATGQENIVQNVNYLPQPATQTASTGTTKGRTRRSSDSAARKNPDGTLSCGICGHSFRSVPALNGHMRVHSSSTDRKNKDERHRKASGSSSGGNESRTPRSLSSPTTSAFNIKKNQLGSMYNNPAAYDSVTLAGYGNPSALYNPALTTMNAGGAVVPITQNTRDTTLTHRITPQTTMYPYTLQHTAQMEPRDALLAAANYLARSEPEHFMLSPNSGHDDYRGLPPVADLQQFIAQQHVTGQAGHGFHGPSTSGVILVQQPGHAFIPGQTERLPGPNVSGPFVTTLPLPGGGAGIAPSQQSFSGSPGHEQAGNLSQVDNLQYFQHSLIQQASNRSTPLADFADIVVRHDQGQLFTDNSIPTAGLLGSQNQHSQQEEERRSVHQSNQEQMQMQDVPSDVRIIPSVGNDLLWPSDSQQAGVQKMGRGASTSIKEEDNTMMTSSMPQMQIHKSNEQTNPGQPESLFFPVSIPVNCSREEATAVTSSLHKFYRQNPIQAFSNVTSSFHDDPLMQDAINVANPSTILPNSMMGGNPGSYRPPVRQRHFSEGSVLKTLQKPGISFKPEGNCSLANFVVDQSTVSSVRADMASGARQDVIVTSSVSPGSKRKATEAESNGDIKKVKTEIQQQRAENTEDSKKEIWSVPKHAAPNRQRHRRHSADSKSLLNPVTRHHFSMIQANLRNIATRRGYSAGSCDSRGKRRPPPLLIPASVNTYSNGSGFISQLHQRRRPSGDSSSTCGNDKIPPYTPPPMLSPHRFGSGLYYNTPSTPAAKPTRRQGSGEICPIPPIPEEEDDDEELVRSDDPKINIGSDYQAEIPSPCPRWRIKHDVHKAKQVWKPTREFEDQNSTQSRHVEEYLNLACSAAVPYGGCNKEFALHLLYKNKGDILASVRELLHPKVTVPSDHWMASYTYLGSSTWSLTEKQTFDRAMMEHHKEFYKISRAIRTKTTQECVDYYYHIVKRRRRRVVQRPRRFRNEGDEENAKLTYSLSPKTEAEQPRDFMQDYLINAGYHIKDGHIGVNERKTSEVLRRSPPQTAFIRAPHQMNQMAPSMSPQVGHNFAGAQAIQPIHSYARQPVQFANPPDRPQIPSTRDYAPPHQNNLLYQCKVPNCGAAYPTVQLLGQHQELHKAVKPSLGRVNQASPSPASSPASVVSVDAPPPGLFTCPRCGKSFGKVKSRNAHMKTHGKSAQEKREKKEAAQRKKMEEAAAWRNRAQQHQPAILHPSQGREQMIQYQHVTAPRTKQGRM